MEQYIWVEFESNKSTDGIWTIKGQIQKSVFDGIVSNQLTKGYVKLDRVYWVSTQYDDYGDPDGQKLTKYGGEGKHKDYRGDIYLKVEHIISVSPIDGEAELARFEKEKVSPLRVVTPFKGN